MHARPAVRPPAIRPRTLPGLLAALSAGLYLTRPASGAMHIVCPKSGHLQGGETSNGTTTCFRCDDGGLTKLP
jgi:hypothetical protein